MLSRCWGNGSWKGGKVSGKVMRTLVCVARVVVFIVFVIGGYYLLRGSVSRWAGDTKGTVQQSSDGRTIGTEEPVLSEAEAELKTCYVSSYQLKIKLNRFKALVKRQQDKLARDEENIKRALRHLEESEPSSKIKIGPAIYTWEEVNQDTLHRIGLCKVLRQTIHANEQRLSVLRKAYDDSTEIVCQKKEDLRRNKIEYDDIEVQFAAIHVMKNSSSDFYRSLNEELTKAEFHKLELGTISAWNTEIGTPQGSAVEAAKAYFTTETSVTGEIAPEQENSGKDPEKSSREKVRK